MWKYPHGLGMALINQHVLWNNGLSSKYIIRLTHQQNRIYLVAMWIRMAYILSCKLRDNIHILQSLGRLKGRYACTHNNGQQTDVPIAVLTRACHLASRELVRLQARQKNYIHVYQLLVIHITSITDISYGQITLLNNQPANLVICWRAFDDKWWACSLLIWLLGNCHSLWDPWNQYYGVIGIVTFTHNMNYYVRYQSRWCRHSCIIFKNIFVKFFNVNRQRTVSIYGAAYQVQYFWRIVNDSEWKCHMWTRILTWIIFNHSMDK